MKWIHTTLVTSMLMASSSVLACQSELPRVTSALDDPVAVCEGNGLYLEGQFTPLSDPATTVTWLFDNVPIEDGDYYEITTTSGQSTLSVFEVAVDDEGVYTLKIENCAGSASTNSNVTVEECP